MNELCSPAFSSKVKHLFLTLFSALCLSAISPSAYAGPFSCSGEIFQVQSGQLRIFDPISYEYINVGPNVGSYNAAGYNTQDNFAYASQGSNVIRIHSDGSIDTLFNVGFGSYAGDVDGSNRLWLRRSASRYSAVNLATGAVNTVNFSGQTQNSADVAWTQNGGTNYLIAPGNRRVGLLNIDNSTSSRIDITGLPTSGGFGATWTDVNMRVFTFHNNTGQVFELFDLFGGGPARAELVAQGVPSGNNDGFACRLAPFPNLPPLAIDDDFVTPINVAVSGNVLDDNGSGIDSDPDGGALTVNTTPLSGPSNGSVTLNSDGSFTYTPDPGFFGTDTFEYEIEDPTGLTATATVTIVIQSPQIMIAKTADVSAISTPANPGEVITYTIVVDNTGNLVLTSVAVTDTLQNNDGTSLALTSGPDFQSSTLGSAEGTLNPGEMASYTVTYALTPADIASGGLSNVASTTASSSAGGVNATIDAPVVNLFAAAPSLAITKSQTANADEDGSGSVTLNDTLTYSVVATNDGNVTQANVTVSDPQLSPDTEVCLSVDPGDTCTLTGTLVVDLAASNAATVDNTAEASSDEVPVAVEASVSTPVEQLPALTLDKSSSTASFANVNDPVSYDYLVTNTGSVTISALNISDDKVATVNCPVTTLDPGASTTCTATYAVMQEDLDAGSVTNIAQANGTAAGGTLTPPEDTETVNAVQTPGLTIDKTSIDTDFAAVGDTLDYSYEVTNSGNVTITSPISVTDDKILPPFIVNCPALPADGLAPNDSLTCTAMYSVTQEDIDAGNVTNIASATDGTSTSPTDSVSIDAVQTPVLTLLKSAVETSYQAVGDTLHYEYLVSNNGNVLISNLSVSDDLISSVICNVSTVGNADLNLDPGESVTCTGTYTVTQDDINNGSVTNNASATGNPAGGVLVDPTSSATVNADQQPQLTLSKVATTASFAAVGDTINYEYRVTNEGNVAISSLVVTDDKIASVTCNVSAVGNLDAVLDPMESVVCTGSYAATQIDLDNGSVVNNAEADGMPAGGTLIPATDQETVTANQQPRLEVAKTATTINFTLPGDITTYEYVVTNTGNVTLTDAVMVTDNLVSVDCPPLPPGGLAPNAMLTCTADYVVTQADLDAGSVTNLAQASSGPTTSPQTSETIPASQDPALSMTKTALFTSFSMAGEVVTYEYEVSNDGNLTLTGGVDIVDDKIGVISCVSGNFVPNAVQTCTATYTITQQDVDAGEVTNQAFAQNGSLVSAPQQVTVAADQTPMLGFAKRATTATYTNAGDVINYEFDVNNTGNVTLTGLVINDDLIASVVCPVTTLAPSEGTVCTGSYTVTQADADAGTVINNADASAFDPDGSSLTENDTATVNATANPSLDFTKRALTSDFDAAGDVLSYEFDVVNDGSVTLTNVVVTDNLIATVNCPLNTLAPMQSMVCSASYTVTQADLDAGSVTNVASAGATLPGGGALPVVTDTATVDGDVQSGLSIVKTAVDTSFAQPNDTIDYTYLVENTGNVTLNSLSVTDDLIAVVSCPVVTLAPAQTTTCTGTYTVTQADIDSGSVTNIASVTATGVDGSSPEATDTETVNADQMPLLSIVKTPLTASFATPGEVLNYEYTVTNAGNTTLLDPVTVADNLIASVNCPPLPAGGLVPGADVVCNASYLVTQADIDAGSVTNTASATSGSVVSPVTDATVNANQMPMLVIVKNATTSTFQMPGDTIDYTYTVTNSGNTTVVDPVSVDDDKISTVDCPALPAGGLIPGASIECTATYATTQADIDAGSVTNVATATDGTIVSDPATATVLATQMPSMSVKKTATVINFTLPGDVTTYEYAVTNDGNVSITEPIVITDNLIPNITCPALPLGGLQPDDSITCTGQYTVTQDDLDLGSTTNLASAASGPLSSPPTSETIPANAIPALTITKTAITNDYTMVGDELTYEYAVQNTGNVTLTSTTSVVDDKIGTFACFTGNLVPGQTETCQATYTVTQADLDLGFVRNDAYASHPRTVSPPAFAVVNADQAPEIELDKRALTATFDSVGDVLNYEFEVTNIGNVTILSPISVADSRIAVVSCPALPANGLAPGASIICTGTDVVDQADLDLGQVDNTAQATSGGIMTPTDMVTVNATKTPDYTFIKRATTATYVNDGDVINYEFDVVNTGNQTLSNIAISDSIIPTVTCPLTTLAPMQGMVCMASYTVDQDDADAGQVDNTAEATALDPDGNALTRDGMVTVTSTPDPSMSFTKRALATTFAAANEVINYEFDVLNDGSLTLSNIVLTDDLIDSVSCPQTTLAPNDSMVCTASYTLTQDDVDSGSVTNNAQANAALPDGSSLPEQTDSVVVDGVIDPQVSLEKTALQTAYAEPGDVINYTYVVSNTGNVTLSDIDVTDNLIATVTCPVTTIAPGTDITCTASYPVTQQDIDSGSVTNLADVTANAPNAAVVTDTSQATVNATQAPALTLVKTALTATFDDPGDMLSYEYTATNSGNTTITTPIVITDNLIDLINCPAFPPSGLAPDATYVCTATYSVTQADIDAGSVTNTASAAAGSLVSPTVDATVNATQTPELTLDKQSMTPDFAMPGDTVSYMYIVQNSGNTTIVDAITVSDDKISAVNCPALPVGGLLPNATLTCTADYAVTQADIDAGSVINIATASDGSTVSNTDTVTVTASQNPSIMMEKTATDINFTLPGDTVSYEYVVTNDGNVTVVDDLTVSDNLISAVTCPALPPGGLLPGDSLTCTASYTVTQQDLDLGSVTNLASAQGGPLTSPPTSETIPANALPALTITKASSTADYAMVGDVLTYDYTVQNTGNTTLTGATDIVDNRIGTFNCFTGNLVPGQIESCQATYTVVQADIDAGSVRNDAYGSNPRTVSPPVFVEISAVQAPAITLEKRGLTSLFAAVGDVLDYEFEVTNSGNVTLLAGIAVDDDRIAIVDCPALPAGGLAPGESLVCTGSDTVSQADLDAGSVVNTATANTGGISSSPTSVTINAIQEGSFTIDKDSANTGFAAVGDVLSYTYLITNTGNITQTAPFGVIDDKIGSVSCPASPAGGLPPNGQLTCTADYLVTQEDLDAGEVMNIAFADSNGFQSQPDQFVISGTQAPELTLVKTANVTTYEAVGDIANYTYEITNTGNVTIVEDVSVTDDRIDLVGCPAVPVNGLAPGTAMTCTASYTITQADLDAGEVTNIATATDGTTESAPDQVTITAVQTSGLDIEKRALTDDFRMPGDVVSYEYDVTNTGNVTITSAITVLDDKIATVSCPALPAGGLAPQAVLTCTADYEIEQGDVDSGFVTNIASATDGTTSSADVEVTVDAIIEPALNVTKEVTDVLQVGGPVYDVTYAFALANTGNQTLSDVMLTDELANILAPAVIFAAPELVSEGFAQGGANAAFDGQSDTNLLVPGTVLNVSETGSLTLTVRIDTTEGGPAQSNTAVGTAAQLTEPVPSNDPTVTPGDGDDTNPTPLVIVDTDGDGAPDTLESAVEDRDGDGIVDSDDIDPTGYFYCEENGQILTGGGVTITGPAGANSSVGTQNNITLVSDGSQGFYQFYVTEAGRYTLTANYPASGVPSTARLGATDPVDATSFLPSNPVLLGSTEFGDTGRLADFSVDANPVFYTEFDLEPGDPIIFANNLPLKFCGTPEADAQKSAPAEPEFADDGRQRVTYELVGTNSGETVLQNVQITDDLAAVFGTGRVDIEQLELTDAPAGFAANVNAGFNGESDINVLQAGAELEAGESITATVTLLVDALTDGEYENTATFAATAPLDGAAVTAEDTAVVTLLPLSDASSLHVTKTAQPRTVQIGDPVRYTITVENRSAATLSDIAIVDRIPEGFAYIPNTARIGDATDIVDVEPVRQSSGTLRWDIEPMAAAPLNEISGNETLTVTLQLLAGPEVEFGAHENQAYAEGTRTGSRSNIATAIVDYIPEPTFDCTPVIGRVYDDVNHNGYPDEGEPGLPAVRLATVNGDLITTDEHGRYHIPCAAIAHFERGSNFLLKADTRTLPLGYAVTTENPRVVRATRGKFIKINFGAAHRPKLRIDVFPDDIEQGTDVLTPDALLRMSEIVSQAGPVERAVVVYHASDTQSMDKAQKYLDKLRVVVRSMAGASLQDIALEASWGQSLVYTPVLSSQVDSTALAAANQSVGNNPQRADYTLTGLTTAQSIGNNNYPSVSTRADAGLRGRPGTEPVTSDTRRSSHQLSGRAEGGTRESARPGRLQRWIGWGNSEPSSYLGTSAYSEAPEIETTVDAMSPVKRLNVQANMVSTESGRSVFAETYNNYSQFISKVELRIFKGHKSQRGTPLATVLVEDRYAHVALERLVEDLREEHNFIYVLRAYGHDGTFDETAPKPLRVGDEEFDLSLAEWHQQRNTAFGSDTLHVSNIVVPGASVRVYGRNIPGRFVTVAGQRIEVDEQGRFVAEQLMAPGERSVDISVEGVNGEQHRIARQLTVPSSGTFVVGQAEVTVGDYVKSYDGKDSFDSARLAFYLRSRLNERWSLTATADTGEAEIDNLLRGLDDKDVGSLLRRLDPDKFYPTYGDDSVIEQDAPTSGRVYVRLERGDDYALFGNYQANFADTEFMRMQRTLYGAKLRWDSDTNPTRFGDHRATLQAYGAEAGTRHGRDELRGTGGSVYYLRHGDISIGSEILRVETRDSVSGIVIQTRLLTYGSDYDIDFIQGRIILNEPLASSNDDDRLFRDGTLSGHEQVLIADYEFSPVTGVDDDASVYGARATRWFGDHLKAGVSYARDSDGTAVSDIVEADVTLQFRPGTYLKGEIAQSKGLGVNSYRSNDGGFTYNPLPTGGLANNASATAYAVEGALDFADFGSQRLDGRSYVYWRKEEAGFASFTESALTDRTQLGAGLDLEVGERHTLSLRSDVSDDRSIGTDSFAEARWDYRVSDALTGSVGASYNDNAGGLSGTSAGARLEYQWDDDSRVWMFGQFGVSGDNPRTTDRVGVGGEYRLTSKILTGGELSDGEDGFGARYSLRYQPEDGDEYYIAYDLPLRSSAASELGTLNLGLRKRYTEAVSVFGEQRAQFGKTGLSGVTHAYGVDYRPGGWTFNFSGENGQVDNFDREAVSTSIGYGGERFQLAGQLEYRTDESIDSGDERNTRLFRLTGKYQANDEWRLQAKYNLAYSDQTSTAIGPNDFRAAEFTEASLSAAYRPIWDDRLNILAKTVHLEDLSPTSQRFDGEVLNYRQRSTISSVDVSYDLFKRWTLGGKYAYRTGEVTSNRDSLDFVKSQARLGVVRLDFHMTHRWDALLEGRYLSVGDGVIDRKGGLFGAYRHLNDEFKLGGGVAWGGIEENYLGVREDEDLQWFINLIGKF